MEEVKNVHREPHPFVGLQHIGNFVGKTVAFAAKSTNSTRIPCSSKPTRVSPLININSIQFSSDSLPFNLRQRALKAERIDKKAL